MLFITGFSKTVDHSSFKTIAILVAGWFNFQSYDWNKSNWHHKKSLSDQTIIIIFIIISSSSNKNTMMMMMMIYANIIIDIYSCDKQMSGR